jgi:uncharacterized OsmC-like protein
MSQETVKNALISTISALKENPAASKVIFRAGTELVEDVSCKINIRNFDPILVDEPTELGGKDSSFNPVELVLGALGTCQEIMYAAYASVMDIQLDSVAVDLKGKLNLQGLFGLDQSVPAGFTNISYETTIVSPADPEQIKNLITVVETHCPVLDTLVRSIEVTGTVKHNGTTL